jgi:hypothetical protein
MIGVIALACLFLTVELTPDRRAEIKLSGFVVLFGVPGVLVVIFFSFEMKLACSLYCVETSG